MGAHAILRDDAEVAQDVLGVGPSAALPIRSSTRG
jgi:hypothetical protein